MKLKRMLSMGLATVLAAGMLAGCGSSDESQAASGSGSASGTATSSNVTPVGEYPIVNEPITFTIMGRKDPGAPDWSELEVFQRLSEITNINFEFEISESGTWTEQKNIALVGRRVRRHHPARRHAGDHGRGDLRPAGASSWI